MTIYGQDKTFHSMRARWYRDKADDARLPLRVRINHLDSLISITEGPERFAMLHNKVNLLYDLGDYDRARALCDSVVPLLPADSLERRLNMQWSRALMAFILCDYSKALETAYGILQTAKPDSLRYVDSRACTVLVDFFMEMGNIRLTRKYQDMASEILGKIPLSANFRKKERERLDGVFKQMYANIYITTNCLDSAYSEIMAVERGVKDDVGKMTQLIYLGEIARKYGKTDMALEYYTKALNMEIDNFNRCFALLGYMELLLEKGDADGAAAALDTWREVAAKIKGSPLEPDFLAWKADFHRFKGNHEEEALILRRILELNDSLESYTRTALTDEIDKRYENISSEKEAHRANIVSRHKTWIITGLGFLSIALLILAIFFLMQRRKESRRTKEAENMLDDIKKKHSDEVRDTEESLEGRNRELSAMTMLMSRLNEALNRIQMVSDDTSIPAEERLVTVKSTLRTLEREGNVWEMFRLYFEKVNQSFFNRLYRLCPTLTNAEIRMCAFILMNLTTKETAILTNRSARTVETIKHNLRKKLGITGSSEAFMRKISSVSESEFLILEQEAGHRHIKPVN